MKSLLAAVALLALSPSLAARCLPNPLLPHTRVTIAALPAGVSARYDHYAAWVCQTPTGYIGEAWIFGLSELGPDAWKFINGEMSVADAIAKIDALRTPNTDSEAAFISTQVKAVTPNAVVAFNGSKTTRSVYQANADGTLNPTPIPNASVAVAAQCNPGLRIAGTTYYSVQGQPNASSSGQALGAVFSICVVSLPLGSN